MEPEGTKVLLLTIARQIWQRKSEERPERNPTLTRNELLEDALADDTTILKPLHRLSLDHALDELIQDGRIEALGRDYIEPTF